MGTNAIEPKSDVELIETVARDYAEGWYGGDTGRMARCLHPDLVNRTLSRAGPGWTMGETSTREDMIAWTEAGGGMDWSGDKVCAVEVLDIFRDIATVRCQSPEYVDYLHLARFGAAGWKIVDVLWQERSAEDRPGT